MPQVQRQCETGRLKVTTGYTYQCSQMGNHQMGSHQYLLDGHPGFNNASAGEKHCNTLAFPGANANACVHAENAVVIPNFSREHKCSMNHAALSALFHMHL